MGRFTGAQVCSVHMTGGGSGAAAQCQAVTQLWRGSLTRSFALAGLADKPALNLAVLQRSWRLRKTAPAAIVEARSQPGAGPMSAGGKRGDDEGGGCP